MSLNIAAAEFVPTFGEAPAPPLQASSPCSNRKRKGKKNKGKNKGGGPGSPGNLRRRACDEQRLFKPATAHVNLTGTNYSPTGAAYAPSVVKTLKCNYSPTGAMYGPCARLRIPAALTSPTKLADIISQIDFYFGDANFPKDKFLQKLTQKAKDRYIPIAEIAAFKKVRKMTTSWSLVVKAMQVSQIVEVSANRKLVRRRNQQVEVKINDAWRRTVVAENMSTRTGGPSVDETRAKFEVAGKVVHVRNVDLNQKRLPPDLAKYASIMPHQHAAFQRRAQVTLVEYKELANAVSACDMLTDKKSWRAGLKVTMLMTPAKQPRAQRAVANEEKTSAPAYSKKDTAATDANGDVVVLSRKERERRRLLEEHPELATVAAAGAPARKRLGLQKKGTVGFSSCHVRMPFGPQNAGEAGGPPEHGFGKGRGKPLMSA